MPAFWILHCFVYWAAAPFYCCVCKRHNIEEAAGEADLRRVAKGPLRPEAAQDCRATASAIACAPRRTQLRGSDGNGRLLATCCAAFTPAKGGSPSARGTCSHKTHKYFLL